MEHPKSTRQAGVHKMILSHVESAQTATTTTITTTTNNTRNGQHTSRGKKLEARKHINSCENIHPVHSHA